MKAKKLSVIIYSIVLFTISAAVVFLIFPKNKQFAYSFSLGTPWLHEDLTAEFDFPVYKTDYELQQEKDSVAKYFIPHYKNDSTKYVLWFSKISKETELIAKAFVSNNIGIDGNLSVAEAYASAINSFLKSLNEQNKSFYETGVLEIPDTVVLPDKYIFYFSRDGISEISYGYEFKTVDQLNDRILSLYSLSDLYEIDSLNSFSIRRLLTTELAPANIIYDKDLNDKLLKSKLESLSPVSGMVQKGQLIIRKGNIVGQNENRMLLSLQKQFEKENDGVNSWLVSSGTALIFALLFFMVFLYLFNFQPEALSDFKTSTFLTIQILLTILTVYVVFAFTEFSVNVVPFALFPLLMITFYNFRIAFIVYLASLLIAAFFAPNSFEFLFIQILTGLAAMFSLRNKQKRRQIFISMGVVLFSYIVLVSGFTLIKQGNIDARFASELYPYAISSFLVLLYLPFVFIYEKSFGLISDYTLMELSDTNNPALRLIAERAPGTFQHSIQVANLVEAVVRELGGNALLARTGALYHDLGKTQNPEYFIENQSGTNIHDSFDYEESALKIISHVNAGTELARKYKLPTQVSEFITAHHGTSLTRYFYNSWVNANPDSMPVITNFKYPGPKPNSIETVVMMMADAIEAASRTLPEYSPEAIENAVAKIIDAQMRDGQYDEVDITFKQLDIAKKVFADKIKNIYHARIVYPEINKKV
jgi:putative nucleotidyltransferase with HDIG domain